MTSGCTCTPTSGAAIPLTMSDGASQVDAARARFRERMLVASAAGPFRALQSLQTLNSCGCDGCEHALPAVEGGEAALDLPSVQIAGVRFRDSGRTYYVDPGAYDLQQGQHVVIETSRGQELAKVVLAPQEVLAATLDGEVRPVVRVATERDLENAESRRVDQGAALRVFAQKIRDHRLAMKPIAAEWAFNGSRITFSFSSAQRIDFRELVRDLGRHFNTRIELRQVGQRDEARLLGGLGRCGRPLCCSTWLPQFADVSMTMARTQDLPPNPDKISGVCGKLLCCLSYENDEYLQARARMPRLGQEVTTEKGPGFVRALQILKETATIELDTTEVITLAMGEFTVLSTNRGAAAVRGKRRKPRRDSSAPTPGAAT